MMKPDAIAALQGVDNDLYEVAAFLRITMKLATDAGAASGGGLDGRDCDALSRLSMRASDCLANVEKAYIAVAYPGSDRAAGAA
jgi:hypothetical protein